MMNYMQYLMVLGQYMMILTGTWSVKVGTACFQVVQGQQGACMPLYIGKSGDLVGCYRCLTHRQTDKQTTEYSATELV